MTDDARGELLAKDDTRARINDENTQARMNARDERELFAAVTKTSLADAVRQLRAWGYYIDDHKRNIYADLLEDQAKLIAWFVQSRPAPAPHCEAEPDELAALNEEINRAMDDTPPSRSDAESADYFAWDWQGLLWDALGDQTKVDRVLALARERGMFDPTRLAALVPPPSIADEILGPAVEECPLCKLKASTMLHKFCTRGECPVR